MTDHTLFSLVCRLSNQTWATSKMSGSLVIEDGHINLPQGFVWVCTGKHTHFITPEGRTTKKYVSHEASSKFGDILPSSNRSMAPCTYNSQPLHERPMIEVEYSFSHDRPHEVCERLGGIHTCNQRMACLSYHHNWEHMFCNEWHTSTHAPNQ